jgi:hypothetical protein
MSAESATLSIPELEQLLESRKNTLLDLARRREDLVVQIAKLDQQMQQIVDLHSVVAGPRRKRAANAASLQSVLLEVLQKNKKGFKLTELAEKITETGYRSHSANFRNVVYQAIYKTPEVELDEKTGCYRLKK